MAAMALSLDVRLGKPGVYVLNPDARAPQKQDARRAVARATSAVRWLTVCISAALIAIAWQRW